MKLKSKLNKTVVRPAMVYVTGTSVGHCASKRNNVYIPPK